MSALDERNISRFLFNPWAVYVADTGDSQPANPSFYTDNGVGILPAIEFVEAMAYNSCSSILYTVRKDPQTFKLTVTFSIKETTINIMQVLYGGSQDTDGETLTFDGTVPPYKAFWLQTCFGDDDKVARLTIPKARAIDPSEFSTGDSHVMHSATIEALPEIDDSSTLPTFYIES